MTVLAVKANDPCPLILVRCQSAASGNILRRYYVKIRRGNQLIMHRAICVSPAVRTTTESTAREDAGHHQISCYCVSVSTRRDCTFSIAASCLRNDLPLTSSLFLFAVLEKRSKTHLFRQSFNACLCLRT